MKKYITFVIFLSLHSIINAKTNDTIHVSTVGGFFFSNLENSIEDFSYYLINSFEEVDSFKVQFHMLFDTKRFTTDEFNFPILRILKVRNWKKERVYIIVSPTGDSCDIDQPFYIRGKNDLIFEVKNYINKGGKEYPNEIKRFYRIYIVNKENDRFDKYLKHNGNLTKINFYEY